jgi:hypothetical protein
MAGEVGTEAETAKARMTEAGTEAKEGLAQQLEAIAGTAKIAEADAEARRTAAQAYDAQVSAAEERAKLETQARETAIARIEQERRALADDAARFEIRDRRSVGTRVMGALAIALSGAGQALQAYGGRNPSPNMALEVIQRSIDRDFAAQEKMLQTKQLAVAAKDTELGRAYQRYGMTQEATIAAKLALREKYARGLEIAAAGSAGQQAQQNAMALSGQLRQQNAVEREQLERGRYEQLSAEHRRLRMADYQAKQQAAANAVNAAARAEAARREAYKAELDIRSKELDVAAKTAEVAGGGAKKLSAEQEKTRNLLMGVKPAADAIAARLATGDTGDTQQSSWRPDALTPDDKIEYNRDVMQVGRMILRNESGANLPDDEVEKKLSEEYGVFSTDPQMRRRGMERMLSEYYGRMGEQMPGAPSAAAGFGMTRRVVK